jgi:hypothetical protein
MGKVVIFLLSLVAMHVQAQEPDFWLTLADVSFESKVDKDGMEMDVPKFGQKLQGWQGKKVRLKGYLIPMSEFGGKDEYMLSALPFNNCFFCGGAGPETIVELEVKQSVKFTSARITMEGVLVLNERDPDHHMYIIKEATLID